MNQDQSIRQKGKRMIDNPVNQTVRPKSKKIFEYPRQMEIKQTLRASDMKRLQSADLKRLNKPASSKHFNP